jgi:hypothetical protein
MPPKAKSIRKGGDAPIYDVEPGKGRAITNKARTKIKKTAPKNVPQPVPNYPTLSGQKRKPGGKSGDRTEGTLRQRKNTESNPFIDSDMEESGSEFDDFENVDGWTNASDSDMSASDTEQPIELKNIQNTGFVASEVQRISNHSDEIAQQHNLARDLPMQEQEFDDISELVNRRRNDKRGSSGFMADQGRSKFKTLAEDSEDEMPDVKNGQTVSSSQSAPKNGHVPYANIINGVGAELAGYSVNQLHALAPYGSMLNKMSSEQISMLLEKVSSVTPDGRGLFASRPPPRRTSLPAQKRFIVTPGGDKMYM